MRSYRLVVMASLPVAAIGIALARGRKADEIEAPPPPAPAEPVRPRPRRLPPHRPPRSSRGAPGRPLPAPAGLSSLSAQGCNGCHYAAHDSWAASAHAGAPETTRLPDAVRAAGSATVCTQCHLPIAAQHDSLAAGYVDGDLSRPRLEHNPSFDATLSGEGVTCAACHVRGGTILGVHASTNAPHPVTVSTELTDSSLCATCHQLTWPGADGSSTTRTANGRPPRTRRPG